MQAEEGVESHSPSGGLFGASESSSTRSRRYRRRTASLRYLTGALADAETADHANTVPSLTMRVCMPEFPRHHSTSIWFIHGDIFCRDREPTPT